MNIRNIIGENIRIIREFKGYSQEYMAMQVDITQPGYSKIESGSTSLSLEKLVKIAQIQEIEIRDLLTNGQKNFFYLNNNRIANAFDDNLYNERKEIYEKMIKKLEDEIVFLRKLLEKQN